MVLALSIVSTTFTLLALTSRSWSSQAYYYDDGTDLGLNESTPLCVYERSPFYRCSFPRVFENRTCSILNCTSYRPYGYNRTSCRSSTEYGVIWDEARDALGLLGRSQECQEGQFERSTFVAHASPPPVACRTCPR